MPDQRVFGAILLRTFSISRNGDAVLPAAGLPAGVVALHAARPPGQCADDLVLVPFWTSILVRVAAWIVLLQSRGLGQQRA